MFHRTAFAAALLVLSSVVLPGCGGGRAGNAETGDAAAVSAGTGGSPDSPLVGGGTPQVPVAAGGAQGGSVVTGGIPEVPAVTGNTPEVRAIKHPGVGLTLSDLQTLKANVDQGKEPWKSGYDQLANSPTSRLSYAGRGGPFAKVSRAPDENLNAWRSDMVAISDLSRMWYFTQNEQYAVNARKLLLGWATTCLLYTSDAADE